MGRPPNPNRKPELMGQILQHVATASLAQMTFRSLASALGVSTYVLVYHFGSRQQLIDAILDESVQMRRQALQGHDIASFDRATMAAWMRESFRVSLEPRHAAGIRLQFEAGALERIDPDIGQRITESHRVWTELFELWLTRQGLEASRVPATSRLMTDTLFGTQFGYLMHNDLDRTLESFELALDLLMSQLDTPRVRAFSA